MRSYVSMRNSRKNLLATRQDLRNRVLSIEHLEERRVLTASPYYIPETSMWTNDNEFLSAENVAAPMKIAMRFLESNAESYGLTVDSIQTAKVTDQYTDADTGISHIYLRQQLGGLEIENTSIGIHLTGRGQVITVSNSFVPNLSIDAYLDALTQDSAITAAAAALAAMDQLDLPLGIGPIGSFDSGEGVEQTTLLSVPGLSMDSVRSNRVWIPNPSGSLDLAWEMIVRTPDGEHWYHLGVDASTGDLRMAWDWIDDASYTVLPIPTETPADGPFQTVTDPHLASPLASPFGWHDTNGLAGAEFTTTIGNNVDAHLDRNGDNVADVGSRPDGGSALNFNATFNASLSPLLNANAAVTNLFYWNNVLHDVHYLYGFTPAAGNFQTNNYGQGGFGNDAVQADAQDNADNGSANNANFGTPPDGSAPRMQMFEFTSTSPRRDSDLDSSIMTHEYGHGVSNRLTGGPANSSALGALQSGGMGEGWSDFWSLMFRQKSAIDTLDARGVGMYVVGQANNGPGIRSYRYDFDIGNQTNETFLSFGTGTNQSTQVHWVGTRWASTLWDLNHLLIGKYGYESNIYNSSSSAGNILALRLVMDALKLQPANPSLVQARDALLAADTALNGGANLGEIWTAFARRGLGQGATTASSSSNTLITSFTVPPQFLNFTVSSTVPLVGSIVTSPTSVFTVNLSMPYLPSTVDASDFLVGSIPATGFNFVDEDTIDFTFAITPLGTQGLHTMSMAAGSILRESDASALSAFSESFRWDVIPLQVATVIPASSSVIPVGQSFVLDVDFNEVINPSTISSDDVVVNLGSVTSAVALDADTARYTISNLNSEGSLIASLLANKVADIFGNPNASNFTANYIVDRVVGPFQQTPTANSPLGGMIYETSGSGWIGFSGDSDGFTISLNASQTLSILVTPVSSTLRPQVELLDPANTSIGIASAASNGVAVLLPLKQASAPGTYRINVSGVDATLGDYTVRLVLNATIESESAAGALNQTSATAEDLTPTSLTLSTPLSQSRRMAVLGAADSVSVAATTPSFTDISLTGTRSFAAVGDDATDTLASTQLSGFTFPFYGTTYNSVSFNTNGLITFGGSTIEWENTDLSASPSLAVIAVLWDDLNIDNSGTGTATRAIFWQVTGIGATQRLIVQWNNVRILGGSTYFTMQAVLSLDGTIDLNYSSTVVSSVVTSATVGIKATGTSNPSRQLLHFNQAASPLVGPNLSTRFLAQATPDFYKLDLAAGESLTLAISNLATGNVDAELIGSDGITLLAGAVSGPTNLHKAFQNFSSPGAGTYFIRVNGSSNIPYSMVLAVNASFDAESNGSFATAQTFSNGGGAIGAIETTSDFDWYSIDVTQPDYRLRIQTATPSDGTGEFLNTLNPVLELYTPDNNLLASGLVLGDGRNESITVPLLPTVGTYRIRVNASGGTKGEYYLSANLSAADITPPTIGAVKVASTAWSIGFTNFLDPVDGDNTDGSDGKGFQIPTDTPANQLRPLPWTNMNSIVLAFSEQVIGVNLANIDVIGVNKLDYKVAGGAPPQLTSVTYNSATNEATLSFNGSLTVDKLLIKIGNGLVQDTTGNALAAYSFRLNVLPGDVNQNAVVANNDITLIRAQLGLGPEALYDPRRDLNGNGVIANNDVTLARPRLGNQLPPTEPL